MNIYALTYVFLYLAITAVSFNSLQALRFDQLFKAGKMKEIQVLLICLSMSLSYVVTNFIIDLIKQTNLIMVLF
ncbi:DUF1146 family protein [Macrococcoides bohemicum]|uniref:DUF1146 family protein n=1 Tax=Macrococcoides bohemicum TaxID=1903056 RepID=A0AAE7QAP8_9STAP|nr:MULTISPECIES: DUF1146 domain-containing protein [Macrococcus]ATD31894.1 hypothetical protein BHM04_12160 [Macrococcus sp. IME1552]MBC9875363.1 DUF1146 domain-containing protein [Macrococcus bohemicus]QRN50674.1 DUF1146 domain-containing protein [Macrococcus bohemicus]QYA42140.1 DUF1146 family protein [Macrococcus bohemicus]QYA44518.1 DUF1146 family protein [Macrococcus bohemicus]